MTNAINRAQFTVSNTPGTSGDFTVSTAQTDFRTLGAAQDGLPYDGVLIVESGLGWEVRNGCTYTHGTTTLGRGTLEDSSSGGAIDFTSAAIVSIGASARSAKNATLTHVAGSDADTTMSVGSLYVVDMSAWSTADRNYTLPASANVGDRIGVLVKAGSATRHLILKANAGDTLNGITAAEWSRLFITGEIVIMRCVEANAAWMVERDGRIPMVCELELTTSATTNTANTFSFCSAEGGAWTARQDNASLAVVASDRINVRRACSAWVSSGGRTNANVTSTQYCNIGYTVNGTTVERNQFSYMAVTAVAQLGSTYPQKFAAGDYIRHTWRPQEANRGMTASRQTYLSMTEILT